MAEMAVALSEHAPWIRAALKRFKGADLLQPFRAFSYYHPQQRGSASIKHVLPVLTSISYADLSIGNGALAASEFQRITVKEPTAADAPAVREHLLRYCRQDTMALVAIYRRLCEIAAEGRS